MTTIDEERWTRAVAKALHSVIVHDCDPRGVNHCEPEQHLDNARQVVAWAANEYKRELAEVKDQ